jgi:hypothetical protein
LARKVKPFVGFPGPAKVNDKLVMEAFLQQLLQVKIQPCGGGTPGKLTLFDFKMYSLTAVFPFGEAQL